MRLSKLKLAGFKTFVDPTTVVAPGSLVGVVGPNGCGKSNIIDAVRWVLGETRASALRGESMQDVIFNGSSTRKPVSRASVELVFDNVEGRITGQWSRYSEISVKRVLDRSGESNYLINNLRVRRKDVVDLFLGTGLGPRAYAIIEQGMISRIIEARPEEIRSFLEEAAGVTKYRERRRETEGRLSDARDNLARLDDIRMELGERITHLQAQAEQAERYRSLHAAHVERQQLLWLIKRNAARNEHRRIVDELNQHSGRMETDSARLQELEAAVETAREAHFAASEAVHIAQTDLYAASSEVSRLESELQHLSDSRRKLETRLNELDTELAHWHGRVETLEAERLRWQELSENAALRVERAQARHDELAEQLPDLEAAKQTAELTVGAVRRELTQTEQLLRVEEAKRASAGRTLDSLAERHRRLEEERATLAGPEEQAVAASRDKVEMLRAALEERKEVLSDLQHRLPQQQALLKSALEEEQQAQRTLTELKAHREALRQLQAKTQSDGVLDEWLAGHGFDSPPLWQSLQVEPGWDAAVEAVLRERLSACIGNTTAAGNVLSDPPPASFVLGFTDTPAAARNHDIDLSPLAGKLRCTGTALSSLVDNWLHGYYAVEQLDDWLVRRETLPAGVTLVDPAGRLLTRDALTHLAPDSHLHGVTERQREIAGLDETIASAQEVSALANDKRQNTEQAAFDTQSRISELRRDIQNEQSVLHAEEVTLLKLEQAMSRTQERRTQIERDLHELDRQASAERELIGQTDLEQARAQELVELLHARLEGAQQILSERDDNLREWRAMEQAASRDLQEANFSARECAGKLDDISRNRALAAEQIERIRTETENRRGEIGATDDFLSREALQQALTQKLARETALAARRDALEQAEAQVREIEETRLRIEQQAAPIRTRVAELRLAVQAAELTANQFDERLAEVGADETALAPLLVGAPKEISLQREVSRLAREIEELGPVNLAALDELKSASERKGYLDAQNDDLMQAITTLEDAIRRIDRETREQLQTTYDTVNSHVAVLFPQLFGGGRAELILTGEEILDAGIQIVAQPPGKKNSTIHLLSGGEKALTAIALVFSLFQLNPAPFCMLDEVDAPLDDTNTERYGQMLRRMSSQTQFIFISHNRITMEIAEQLVGVTMQEQGVSRVVEVDMQEALRLAETAAA